MKQLISDYEEKYMDIAEYLVNEETSIIEAMTILNKTAKKVLFVTEGKKLLAAVTDGDIRRWILKKGNLDAKVKDVANFNPLSLKDSSHAQEYIRKHSIEALPIINNANEIVSIVFAYEDNIVVRKNFDIPVVIMAGGLGTRLYPYTKILPKPLIPVGEIPITEHIINRFNNFGCKKFFMIVNHKKNMIKAYFNEIEKDYDIAFIDENKPLGTGGGLSLLKGKINSTFVLSNCDIFIDEDIEKIYSFHKSEKNYVTMVCSLKKFTIPYGVIEINGQGEINKMQEKPEFTFFTNTGMYIVEPDIFDAIEKDQEIDFPDIIERARIEGKRIGVFPISEDSWIDIGQLEGMEEMQKRLSERI